MRFILCLLALPAYAQPEITFAPTCTGVTPREEPGYLLALDARNETPDFSGVCVFSTEQGDVTVRHTVTGNGPDGCCADVFDIIDQPAGTVALPPSLTLEEGEDGDILIMEWSGS